MERIKGERKKKQRKYEKHKHERKEEKELDGRIEIEENYRGKKENDKEA